MNIAIQLCSAKYEENHLNSTKFIVDLQITKRK